MSTSTDLAVAYLGERYRSRTFVPLAIGLAAAGVIASGLPTSGQLAPSLVVAFVVAYCFVLAFRLWDDLEDRERDRVEHPERVLVRAPSRAPFMWLIVAAAGIGCIIVGVGPAPSRRLGALAIAAALLFAWYRLRGFAARGLIGAPLILMKYPLIAYVAAPPREPRTSLAFALSVLAPIYIALVAYEMIDDAHARGRVK